MPVLADKPMWRWHKDKIEQGLAAHPEYATPRVREALDTVADVLAKHEALRRVLPDDGLGIIDNYNSFHARTAFTGPERHLLRIPFNELAA